MSVLALKREGNSRGNRGAYTHGDLYERKKTEEDDEEAESARLKPSATATEPPYLGGAVNKEPDGGRA